MTWHLQRLARLERPAMGGNRNQLPVLCIRPEGQTEEERVAFDAAIRKHKVNGGSVVVFEESDHEGILADGEKWLSI